jgi:hypothetical protein
MKCPVESPAEICLGYLTGQLYQLGVREMLPQFSEQFVADFSRGACHGYGKIKNDLLDGAEHAEAVGNKMRAVEQQFENAPRKVQPGDVRIDLPHL